jgi:hypothetical protein
MSVETDFRTTLLARPQLTALVAQRVAQNAIDPGPLPIVAFTSAHEREFALDNSLIADKVTIDAQCWAASSVEADAVADEVEAAIDAAGHLVLNRSSAHDPELDLHATVMTIEWWDQ